ncbi:DUF4936 family protein [Viridibacterium curvum]|uniref:DUF4936 family protein n=1 Tax=Viridibacterium curvum TaxID=1101404 RepID=A0ABP9QBU6_9RHOO
MTAFYVYYRVAPQQNAAVQAAVLRLFSLMQTQTGVAGRLMRRVDDATTWMEVYEGVGNAEAFSDALQQNTLVCGLPVLLDDPKRVVERFEDF